MFFWIAIVALLFSNSARAEFFDRPDYFQNKTFYDQVDDIIDVLYDENLSEKDRYLRLMVKDQRLVEAYGKLKTENEKRMADILREQGLSDEQIESEFRNRKVVDAFKITLENDTLSSTDREYSNGIRVDIGFNNPGFEKFFQHLGYTYADFYALCAQEIHTNSDLFSSKKNPEEPPKAGILYCGSAASAYKMNAERTRIRTLDRFEMRLGVVGKMSLAEEVQNGFHKLIGNKAAQWNNQLTNRIYFAISFERNLKISEGSIYGDSRPEYNIIVNGGGIAGTFASQIGGGVIINFRLLGSLIDMYVGKQLPVSRIESLRAMSFEARLKKTVCDRDWGVNIFVGAGASYVFNNQRFDAQSAGYNTQHVPFVFNLKAGVVVHYKQAMLEFAFVKSTPQWMNTDGFDGDISHAYTSASITLTEDAVRDTVRWMFDNEYRAAVREKNKFRKFVREHGVKIVYQTSSDVGAEKSFILRCD